MCLIHRLDNNNAIAFCQILPFVFRTVIFPVRDRLIRTGWDSCSLRLESERRRKMQPRFSRIL